MFAFNMVFMREDSKNCVKEEEEMYVYMSQRSKFKPITVYHSYISAKC